ncbi:hypothetical protein Tsubulata_038879 [Turnera subulata]|uniref:F-box domain-containing protein n=1 Tax=Turnera subulata TaxID=218843 RepID=A0A9Q0F7K5_9ROSI|nr:hypothetical protein Tsubulata_038879 [Turnera subulata]
MEQSITFFFDLSKATQTHKRKRSKTHWRTRRRRRRIFESSSSSSSRWFPPPSSDQLSDDFSVADYLLVEVFCRLPSIQSLVQCMIVCKAWYRIISTHYFLTRFINHHMIINNNVDDDDRTGNVLVNRSYHNNPYNLIFCYTKKERHEDMCPIYRHHHKYLLSNFQNLGFDFRFLSPRRKKKEEGDFDILDTCNDLFLCALRSTSQVISSPEIPRYDDMYLCNPKWFVTQREGAWFFSRHVIHNHTLGVKQSLLVPLILDLIVMAISHQRVYLNKWSLGTELYMSRLCPFRRGLQLTDILDRERVYRLSNLVAWNGKVHWYNGKDIIAFDPFHIQNHPCSFIKGPDTPTQDHHLCQCCLSVCGGSLRLMKIHSSACTVMVWELKDCKPGSWSLEHNVNLDSAPYIWRLTCHPTDPNVIYFLQDKDVISFNLKAESSEIIAQTPGMLFSRYFIRTLPVVLPSWPTPIPRRRRLPSSRSWFRFGGNKNVFSRTVF